MHKQTAFFHIDWFLVFPVLGLIVFSLLTLLSINQSFFQNQLIFFVIGAFLFLFFSHINYHILEAYAVHIYIASLLILFFLLLVGFESRGAVRWISFFGLAVQFSEILKPFLIISLSVFLTKRESISFKKFVQTLLLLLPIVFFIYRQPDLGSAIIYVLTLIGVLLFYGFPLWWFITGFVSFLMTIPLSWKHLHQYQKDRVLTFLHLTNDPQVTNYNAIQSIYAVGSGKFFGKGFGQGTQSALRFLPERQTDFLFATLSEMVGFFGTGVLILCFAALLYRCFILIQHAEDDFSKIFISGAFFLLLVQFFVNVGMNMGLLPIVGVTFPFVSYGGSSLIANAILLGLVSAMSKKHTTKQVMEIR
jgi:rod shape determining protein RodA